MEASMRTMRVLPSLTVLGPVLLMAALAEPCRAEQPAVIESRALRVTVNPDQGAVTVLDKRCRKTWVQPPLQGGRDRSPFRDLRPHKGSVSFRTKAGGAEVQVTLTAPPNGADLIVETVALDPAAPFGGCFTLDAFLPATSDASIAISDYSDGHLYPITLDTFPATWFAGGRLNMPWVGLCEGVVGPGYAAIIETSDDSFVELLPAVVDGKDCRMPRVGWQPSKGAFAYARRVRFRFVKSGGYVALAKAYRAYAKAAGLLVTLRAKAARNPNVRRLYGAADVWGDASLEFARAAKSAGVERMLIHGRSKPEEMREVNALGYLTSEYDNYTDILPVEPGKEPDHQHDHLPGAAVLKADGKRMEAWLTYDKKTQYMKRCPSLWVPRAREAVTRVLKELPFLGRFIDVTTAEALYECYDPEHPLDRGAKRRCGEDLLKTIRDLGLVVGGEHGIWWAVPHLDYIEGMMSSYQFAWPAGHLKRPKSKDEKFAGPYGTTTWDRYDRFGIGHELRVPLWQLVFHDCVVSTWYWGDSNDFLLQAAPEYTGKKEAFNILYGTMPMLWASREGSWVTDRDLFVRTVQAITPVTANVAEAEMIDHRFLTPDRAVQQTTFSNGTTCIVNFGATPHTVKVRGKLYNLGRYGYAVSGRQIQRIRHMVDNREVTVP